MEGKEESSSDLPVVCPRSRRSENGLRKSRWKPPRLLGGKEIFAEGGRCREVGLMRKTDGEKKKRISGGDLQRGVPVTIEQRKKLPSTGGG